MPTILLSGCAILKGSEILLIHKDGKDFWELPGGIVKSKVDIEQAAVDMSFEQIGVKPAIVQHFTILEYQKNESNIEANIFECDVDPEAKFIPGDKVEEVKWFLISDLKEGKENIGDDVKEILEEL